MASFHPVFLFILVCFINFVTTKAKNNDIISMTCSNINKTTPNNAFQLNLKTLLTDLSSNATANKEFYNTIVEGKNHSTDTLYGQFMCKGDVPAHLCSQCVTNLTRYNLSSDPLNYDYCSLSKEVIIQYDECMVRYSNKSFFSPTHFSSHSSGCSSVNVSNPAVFERLVFKTLNGVADEAANFSIGVKKYATKEATISEFQNLYFQAQCTPDLSPQDCRKCLNITITDVQNCKNSNEVVGDSETYNCYIRYDVYPFYRPSNAPTPQDLVPASNTIDSKYSQHPAYLSHNCSNNETMNNSFLSNLRTLFSSLSSNAIRTSFFKTTVNTVNGFFMCRGDIYLSPTLCQLCVQDAIKRISSECPTSKEAIIWYDKCLLRYSYHSLLSGIDTSSPKFHQFNMANASNLNLLQSFATWILANTLYGLQYIQTETGESTIKNYETRSVKLNNHQTLYTLVQCTPDLSDGDCSTCLKNIFQNEIPWSSLASPEGKILYPSCYMMFGLSQFYRNGDEPEENEKRRSRMVIVVVPIVLSTLLLTFSCYLLRRKARKSSYKTLILKENFGHESTTLEGLQFEMAVIRTATDNFSHENKIGEGGFGEVYKGILSDGRHVAVKRLSSNQDQGHTNKIAGTWGYMSPEYAMLGQFSEKSDVFSFGVIVLEIITGKRNINPYESHHVTEGLTSYVWRQWKNETPLIILDPKFENYSRIEVIKCIQIGLLCVQENPNVRPTMATVVSYLNSHSPELPSPQEPAFFIQHRMNEEVTAQMELSSANNFISLSVNHMSISEFYPQR
ncbi:hypothetical protein P8452_05018 [Trifolium repens]|nr:hypothetical protein P8452_05018 [Trifolium repens]